MILLESDKIQQDWLVGKEDSGGDVVDKEDCAWDLAVVVLEENDKIRQDSVVDKEDCDKTQVLDMCSVVVVTTLSGEQEEPCWGNVVKMGTRRIRGSHAEPWVRPLV